MISLAKHLRMKSKSVRTKKEDEKKQLSYAQTPSSLLSDSTERAPLRVYDTFHLGKRSPRPFESMTL